MARMSFAEAGVADEGSKVGVAGTFERASPLIVDVAGESKEIGGENWVPFALLTHLDR